MTALQTLLDIGSAPTRRSPPDLPRLRELYGGFAAEQLGALLWRKNGFYAFEGALHVFADSGEPPEFGLVEWNAADLWRAEFQGMADDAVYFAEDAFGIQFCIRAEAVCTFDPETGGFERIATDLEDWAATILADYAWWTGHPVAREWQRLHGRLPVGSRLVPGRPFVLGGEFAVGNLASLDAVLGMRFRASIALQIRDLPDGSEVQIRVVD